MERNARILLVDDNQTAKSVSETLSNLDRYQVITAKNSLDGLLKLHTGYFDLIIVRQTATDVPVTDVPADDPYLQMRRYSYIPIIVIGQRGDAMHVLENGADSFMTSPPNPEELIARVESLLRRKRKPVTPKDHDGNTGGKSAANADEYSAPLTPTEQRIDSCLKLNRGRVLCYSTMISEIWGGRKVTLDALHYYVRRLSSKLKSSRIIQMRGFGYRLLGEN